MVISQDSAKKNPPSEGTLVSLQLLKEMNSSSANIGDILEFETTEPIIVTDRVMIPKGTKASGKVIEVEPRKIGGRAGKLSFTINYLNLLNGKVI